MKKRISAAPQGTCSRRIDLVIDEQGVITDCAFEAGCPGNLQGLSALVKGRPASEVARLLRGIQCRNGTSCPDQLARVLLQEGYGQDP